MPSLLITKRHGRIAYAICYDESPRPTFTLSAHLARIPIKPEAAARGLAALQQQFSVPVLAALYPGVDFGQAEIAQPVATAPQPATGAPLLALPLGPKPEALSGVPTASGAAGEPDDSWMWNIDVGPR
jgi:hypothetical protein